MSLSKRDLMSQPKWMREQMLRQNEAKKPKYPTLDHYFQVTESDNKK